MKLPRWYYRIKWTIFPWTAPPLWGIKPDQLRWKPTFVGKEIERDYPIIPPGTRLKEEGDK